MKRWCERESLGQQNSSKRGYTCRDMSIISKNNWSPPEALEKKNGGFGSLENVKKSQRPPKFH